MRRLTIAVSLCVAAAVAGPAWAADYAGTFAGQRKGQPFAVDLSADGADRYAGHVRLGERSFDCSADDHGTGGLTGTFTAGGTAYPFTATVDGDRMTFASGGAESQLTRGAATVAPVGGDAGGVLTLATTATGRAVSVAQPSAKTAEAAIAATLPKVAGLIGGDVKVAGAFTDKRNPARGGADVHGHGRRAGRPGRAAVRPGDRRRVGRHRPVRRRRRPRRPSGKPCPMPCPGRS